MQFSISSLINRSKKSRKFYLIAEDQSAHPILLCPITVRPFQTTLLWLNKTLVSQSRKPRLQLTPQTLGETSVQGF